MDILLTENLCPPCQTSSLAGEEIAEKDRLKQERLKKLRITTLRFCDEV
jgi:hypothetical protein